MALRVYGIVMHDGQTPPKLPEGTSLQALRELAAICEEGDYGSRETSEEARRSASPTSFAASVALTEESAMRMRPTSFESGESTRGVGPASIKLILSPGRAESMTLFAAASAAASLDGFISVADILAEVSITKTVTEPVRVDERS